MTEIDRLIDMLGCDNAMPLERTRWAYSLVDLARAEGKAEGRKDGITKGIARNAYEIGKHEGVAEGAEQLASQIREAAIPIIPEAHICVDDKGFVFMDPCPYLGSKESYGAKVFLVGASVLAPKVK